MTMPHLIKLTKVATKLHKKMFILDIFFTNDIIKNVLNGIFLKKINKLSNSYGNNSIYTSIRILNAHLTQLLMPTLERNIKSSISSTVKILELK
ncbi:hypothetical protein CleRT_12020 [Candidatus Coxiella mudrowiae]|uniref:Uncharacterized protein n=1 Tax=Candidatus Coxiella mudrowiae TaxID=2054173 RepID=A0ABN4HQ31_9COXI|nr:hypothetical protein CleRT_12020 [Candidatus Coxiella mudrowiae]